MVFVSTSPRAQASVEYLVLVGTVLLIIAILSGYAFVTYSSTISNNTTLKAFSTIKTSIDSVYSLGEGNIMVTDISLPGGISAFYADETNDYLYIEFDSFGSIARDYAEFDFNISGTLPIDEGVHTIRINNSNGVIIVEEI
jgi:uncharacterized protein (UPF0333 family)